MSVWRMREPSTVTSAMRIGVASMTAFDAATAAAALLSARRLGSFFSCAPCWRTAIAPVVASWVAARPDPASNWSSASLTVSSPRTALVVAVPTVSGAKTISRPACAANRLRVSPALPAGTSKAFLAASAAKTEADQTATEVNKIKTRSNERGVVFIRGCSTVGSGRTNPGRGISAIRFFDKFLRTGG